jgi:hypothetical protein
VAKERRRRAYLPAGIVILAVLGGGQYYLSNIFAPADTGTGSGGSGGSVPGAGQPLKGEANPSYAVVSVYTAVAADEPDLVCHDVLGGIGGVHFAKDFAAASCEDAIQKAFTKVTDRNAYGGLTVPQGAVHNNGPSSATVYSCAMSVTGGASLGTFVLSDTANGWIVVDHQPDPATCPPAAAG